MRKDKLNLAVFVAALACFVAIITLFPRDARTIERENRAFNRLPEISLKNIFSGGFARDFEPYVSDRVGYRASFVSASRLLERARGLSSGGVRVTGGTLILGDRLMEIFTRSASAEREYADALAGYRAALPGDVRVFSLLAPTRIEFEEEKYSSVSDSERDAIDGVYASLRGAGVITVDAYSELAAHSGEYVYFRSDHHWTQLGAYYAYRAFADAAGFAPRELSEFEKHSAPGFLGYLYNREPSPGIAADTIEWYEYPGLVPSQPIFYPPEAGGKVTYGVFLGGDHAEYVIETGSGGGKTAVVIKDSYANAFIPWLAPHYATIVVLDPREFEGSALEAISRYTDVDLIFVDYVFSTTFTDFIRKINDIK
ncbi:MAG: hypothetical protein LBN99_01065 [Oscillospiraceae bacterium]|jgi:hypothetical protein|nr:hypothetical protein [Oscillospiraceae bacterium]